LFGPQCIHDALDRRTGEIDALRDLAEAQPLRLPLERTQDVDGAPDDLDALLPAVLRSRRPTAVLFSGHLTLIRIADRVLD